MLSSSSTNPFLDNKAEPTVMRIIKSDPIKTFKRYWQIQPSTSPFFTLVKTSEVIAPAPKGILALDLDETLYDTKLNTFINVNEITDLIKQAKQEGFMVVIVTARTQNTLNNNEALTQSARNIMNRFPSADISWIYFTNALPKHYSLNDLLTKYFSDNPKMKQNICLVDDQFNYLLPCARLQYPTIQIDATKNYLSLIDKFIHKTWTETNSYNEMLEHYYMNEYKNLRKEKAVIFQLTNDFILSKITNGSYKTLNKHLIGGNTLLHIAAIYDDLPLAKILLQLKASRTELNDMQRSPFAEACINQSWRVANELSKNLDAKNTSIANGWILLYALFYDNMDIANRSLESGASTQVVEPQTHEDAYNKAIFHNNITMASLIQNKGPQHPDAIPALITAAKHDYVTLPTFAWLIKQKHTNINARWNNETALTTAITSLNIEKLIWNRRSVRKNKKSF
jgi:hypothetical protein